jgi:murein DD-endopeptidase MepM/ murein hydrolase activator NlpD
MSFRYLLACPLLLSCASATAAPISVATSGPSQPRENLIALPALEHPPTNTLAIHFQLPFAPGRCAVVTQGNNGAFSHHERSNRYAWDFSMPIGTPVVAAAAGRVVPIQTSDSNTNSIVLDHGDGLYTLYAHLDRMHVVGGAMVKAGELIGYSGKDYGLAPHLHFTVVALWPSLTSLQAKLFDTANGGVPRRGSRYCGRPAITSEFSEDSALLRDTFSGFRLDTALPAHVLVMGKTYRVKGTTDQPNTPVIYQLRSTRGYLLNDNRTTSDDQGRFVLDINIPPWQQGEAVQQLLFSDPTRMGTGVSAYLVEK